MIEQTGGLGSTAQNGNVYRDNAVSPASPRRSPREQQVTQDTPQQTTDTVSLSAEAVALARNVAPAAAASEAQESPASETPAENAQETPQRYGSINVVA